jgi:hypothetical protein
MKKDTKFPNAIQAGYGFRGYSREASSFWLGREFDTDFGRGKSMDFTKLAAAQRAIGNFVNIVTGKQIPVVFQSNDQSYTDGEKVVIGTKLEDKNFDPAVGLALHEGSHIAYTDFSMFKGSSFLSGTRMAQIVRMHGLDPDMTMTDRDFAMIKDLLNWIEDRRIDFKIYTNAPGYRMYYEAMYNKYFNDKVIDKALIAGEKQTEDWDSYMFHIINFTNTNRQLDALKVLRDIWNLIDLRNIDRLPDTQAALELSIEVYRTIKNSLGINPSTEFANSQTNPGAGNPQSGNGIPGDGDPNSPSSPGENEDGGSESDDDSDDDSDNENEGTNPGLSQKDLDKLAKAIEAQREFLSGKQKKTGKLSKADAAIVNAMRESGTETREVFTNQSGTGCPVTTVVIKKLTPGIICSLPQLFEQRSADVINGSVKLDSATYGVRDIISMNEAVNRGIILGKQLGSKLQLRNSERSLKTTRLAAGKIDRRLVSQLGYDNVNVFHRIVTDRYKNYFIHISIDASGSMSGTKLRQAITSAVAVAQAASMTTGIRVQISLRGTANIGNSMERCVTVYAYDSAKDKISKIRNMFKYLSTFGCTPEGVALKSIENDIKADAKGDELILINYSDGAPTSISGADYWFDPVKFTKRVVDGMREIGFSIISYFITSSNGYTSGSDVEAFRKMYGLDAQFIRPENMTEVSKTINKKFLEITQ